MKNLNFINRVLAKLFVSLYLINLFHGTPPKPEEVLKNTVFVILQSEIHEQLDRKLK